MDLFEYATRQQEDQQPPECDHLPVCDRYFTETDLVCGKCHQVLRKKDL
jgi:hypothetical protein